tara:strand:- start:92 stop:730 length:639 start_codon:yes stop_codon:yes gene_type:complete
MKFYIISPNVEMEQFNPEILEEISEIIEINYLQLRPKYKNESANIKFLKKNYDLFFSVCKKKRIKLIANNNVKITKSIGFDGVHLGQNDTDCQIARNKLGSKYEIGVSCNNSIKLAKDAEFNGANYVAFGPAFKSSTKKTKRSLLDISELEKNVKNINIPFIIIGGINHGNFSDLKKLNPDNIAVINSIWNYSLGPIESAKVYRNLIIKYGM